MQFDKNQYNSKYTAAKYDTVRFIVPKGSKADLQQLADDNGLSLTQFIVQTLEDVHGVDLHTRRPVPGQKD